MLTAKLIQPDKSDRHNCCSVCEKTFQSKFIYRNHFIVHKMQLAPLKLTPDPTITPKADNTSNYCDSCNRRFASKDNYRIHLRVVHKMILPYLQRSRVNPNVLPDKDDPDYYSKSCELKSKNLQLYLSVIR